MCIGDGAWALAGAREAGAAALRGLRVLCFAALVAGEQLDDLLAYARQVGAELNQHLGCDAITLADEAEQQELGADVLVPHLQAFAQGELQYLLGAWGKWDLVSDRLRAVSDDLDDFGADVVKIDTHGLERLCCDAFAFFNKSEQDVFGTHEVMVQLARLLLG